MSGERSAALVRPEPASREVKRVDLGARLALSLPEAARALGVSERHLRSVLPELPHVHLGARVLVPVDALREWLESKAVGERAASERLAQEIVRELEK
ncbi:MAG: helix-turn-helix domain-containing protein [bacterium]|nr:helix-turn-helix domain-containing protein [bacterium]